MVGIVFGYGLMLGGFTERKDVYLSLDLNKKWNPSMIIISAYGLVVSLVVHLVVKYLMYQFINSSKKPVFGV
jgi:hypothetical protein